MSIVYHVLVNIYEHIEDNFAPKSFLKINVLTLRGWLKKYTDVYCKSISRTIIMTNIFSYFK